MRQVIEVPASTSVETGIPPWVQTTSITVVLAVAVITLWRLVSGWMAESRQQNKELISAQIKGMGELKDTVSAMDTANRLGLAQVTAAIGSATVRIDRHEAKLDEHGSQLHALDRRLTVVETGK